MSFVIHFTSLPDLEHSYDDDDDYDDHEEDYIMTELITNSDDNNINDHFEKIDHKLISNKTKSIIFLIKNFFVSFVGVFFFFI